MKSRDQQLLEEAYDNISKMIGNCTQDDVVEGIFGSVSEFARQVEENGDEFVYGDRVVVKYDESKDIHYFFYL
jgi:hypothetical protein